MVIIVPDDSLSSFLQNFTAGQWDDLVDELDSQGEATETPVTIPGFKFEYEKKLNDELMEMGMADAFDPYVADLSGISDAGLYVDFVKQNTFLEVNEEGTEAAAVTTIGIYETSIPEPFTVDRPFIFAIRERTTRAILFIGKVSLPSR
jgi:serpin B